MQTAEQILKDIAEKDGCVNFKDFIDFNNKNKVIDAILAAMQAYASQSTEGEYWEVVPVERYLPEDNEGVFIIMERYVNKKSKDYLWGWRENGKWNGYSEYGLVNDLDNNPDYFHVVSWLRPIPTPSLIAEIQRLKEENAKLRNENEDYAGIKTSLCNQILYEREIAQQQLNQINDMLKSMITDLKELRG